MYFRRKITYFKSNALSGKTVGKSLFELGTYASSMDQLWADGTMTQVGNKCNFRMTYYIVQHHLQYTLKSLNVTQIFPTRLDVARADIMFSFYSMTVVSCDSGTCNFDSSCLCWFGCLLQWYTGGTDGRRTEVRFVCGDTHPRVKGISGPHDGKYRVWLEAPMFCDYRESVPNPVRRFFGLVGVFCRFVVSRQTSFQGICITLFKS